MFLGLFLIFIFNYNDLLWVYSITGFSHPIYSYLKAEHFASGDVLEHKEMIALRFMRVAWEVSLDDTLNPFHFETSRI